MERRIEKFHAGNISPAMGELYEAVTTRIKAKWNTSPAMKALMDDKGRLNGPPSVWLLSPQIGQAFETMVGALRGGASLSPRSSEIVILLTAGSVSSEFEIFAHRSAALSLGFTESEIERLVSNEAITFASPEETAVYQVAKAIIDSGDLNDARYADAVAKIGERGVFEVVSILGIYRTLALQLSSFRVTSDSP